MPERPATERERYPLGEGTANFYAQMVGAHAQREQRYRDVPDVTPADAMPWEDTPYGRLKHLANRGMSNSSIGSLDVFILEIPPGGHSGKHRHFAEEFMFVVEGRGYSTHWTPDPGLTDAGYTWPVPSDEAATRWDWEQGDALTVLPMTVHQHFNTDPDRPARILCAMARAYESVGFEGIEDLESASR
ncbi:MAG: hypothetical protein JO352_38720 [Chloroflexi bacterium]|nr:hypothetical protein [Chloroflexota bacterium]MBV9598884.1 hypothetical protein [Chloroflexota bacterium]